MTDRKYYFVPSRRHTFTVAAERLTDLTADQAAEQILQFATQLKTTRHDSMTSLALMHLCADLALTLSEDEATMRAFMENWRTSI